MKQNLQKKLERYTKSISQQSIDPAKINKIGLTSAAAMAAIVSVPVELNSQVVCGDQGAPIRSLNDCVDDIGGFGYTNYCAQFDFDGDGVDELQVRYYNYNGVFPLASMYVDPLTTQFWTVELSTYFPFANFPETPTLRTDAYFTEYGDKMHIFPLSSGTGFGFIYFDGDAHSWFDNQNTQEHPITGQFICCYDCALTSMWGSTLDPNFVTNLVIDSVEQVTNCLAPGLPVELSRFEVSAKEQAIVLEWTTESEINNAGFAIERSMDGKDFREIAFVDGEGNSDKTVEYQYKDEAVRAGNDYYYRLRQIDYDGRSDYSEVRIGKLESNLTDFVVSPNPVQSSMKVQFDSKVEQNISLSILSMNGIEFKDVLIDERVDSSDIEFDVSELPHGIYFLKVLVGAKVSYKKFVVQR